ncbi:MAG TPA: class I SAM-dependent methyltransferase [Gemmatimonadota bacterium]|nr:class I SAM-dependent methyltransferase [Gemmatimonadota bacterium]
MSARLVDPWGRFWSSKEDLDSVYASSPTVAAKIRRYLPAGARRVLEVGAGTGRDAAGLAAHGLHAVALDASPASLALIGRAHPGLAGRGIVGGDALHLPFSDDTFDAVFHQGVLEHFGNPSAFLAENYRVTRPGGLLVVDVPQKYHPWTLLKRALLRFDRWFAGWETEFTVAELERAVRSVGFEVVDSYGDWMVPSLGYRLLREAAKKVSLPLPLRPRGPAALRRAREAARARVLAPRAARYLAHTIGVVARRPAGVTAREPARSVLREP